MTASSASASASASAPASASASARSIRRELAACAIAVLAGVALHVTSLDRARPPLPPEIVADSSGAPSYDRMTSNVRAVAILGAYHQQVHNVITPAALRRAGVEVIGPLRDARAITLAFNRAIADPTVDVVYYQGHVYDGTLGFVPPPTYKVVVLDTCWGAQRYAPRLLGPTVDVIATTERAITGSHESFLALLDDLRAQKTFAEILDHMNALAIERAAPRHPWLVRDLLTRPEGYIRAADRRAARSTRSYAAR